MAELKRRQLVFDDFSQVRADVGELSARGYERVGNWSLGQMCHHMGRAFEGSTNGFEYVQPWYIRVAARRILPVILWRKKIPEGTKLPDRFAPAADISDEMGLHRLIEGMERFEKYQGPMAMHPFFGKLSNDQWRRLHLIHCAHHLSFLVPNQKN